MSTEDLTAFTPENATVLVTGGTGFVGGHTVARLLREGYRPRVTVRESGQEAEVLAALRQAEVDPADRLEFAIADLSADAGWAEAMDGVSYVLHLASPFPVTPPETEDELILPARDGALRVVSAARKAGVQRVVMTSSYAAGERFIAVSGPSISLFDMAQILRKHFPAAGDLLPSAELTIEQVHEAAKTEPTLREAASLQGRIPVISNKKARSILGWEPRDVRETIVATADGQIGLGLTLPENDGLQA
ncbi:NAD-dependent epimerase/dehydratase family protein [Streptomyces sp. NPDC005069]